MQIMNTFVSKIGPAGKRNRAARRKQARLQAYHETRGHVLNRAAALIETIHKHRAQVSVPVEAVKYEIVPTLLDLSGSWDETMARKALEMFAKSGQSQRAFAAEHSFPESRLRSWKKKLEA